MVTDNPASSPTGTTVPCNVPITIGTFLRSFFSVTAPQPAVKFSSQNPGARFSTFDFTWRTPWNNHLVTVYMDSFAHDNVFPISNLGRSGLRPGIYIARLPGLPRVDFRAEGTTTNVHDPESVDGRLLLWENVQLQGYTNKGYILGDWIGREGTGGQAWLTWHLKPDQQVQLQYRQAKAASDFIPGGTTQNDLSAEVVLRPLRALEAEGFAYRANSGKHHSSPQASSIMSSERSSSRTTCEAISQGGLPRIKIVVCAPLTRL